jgi:hypothetical protein
MSERFNSQDVVHKVSNSQQIFVQSLACKHKKSPKHHLSPNDFDSSISKNSSLKCQAGHEMQCFSSVTLQLGESLVRALHGNGH